MLSSETTEVIEEEVKEQHIPESIRDLVVAEFGEGHVMVEVSRCESGWRQYDGNGNVLVGRVNPDDKGVFQINTYYHLEASVRLGMDIFTPEGNIAYARYLYDTQGVTPWNWSRPCWG